MNKSKINKTLVILLLGLLAAISPFAIDMYLPAFKQIADDFTTTTARISLSISSYFIGLAVGQLMYGPLLDRFGRKKPLFIGLIIFVLASLGCMKAINVEWLVALRFVQAIGGCVAWVAAMTMVRDFFPVSESAKIFSLLVLVIGLSPLLAPTLGGYISTAFSWQWVFAFLALFVVVILLLVFFFLPEPQGPDPSVSLKAGPMLQTFYNVLIHPPFYTYALSGAFSFAAMFIYVSGSPMIFLEIFKVSPKVYGVIFAILSIGFIGGNQVNILLLRYYSSIQIFKTALVCQNIVSILFLICVYNNWLDLYGTLVFFFLVLGCLGFTYPNASALAIGSFTRNIGSASAMAGFIQISIAGLISGVVGAMNPKTSTPLIAMLVVIAIVSLGILNAGKKSRIALAN